MFVHWIFYMLNFEIWELWIIISEILGVLHFEACNVESMEIRYFDISRFLKLDFSVWLLLVEIKG